MSKASTKAKNKYAAKAYDRINLLVPKGGKDTIKAAAVETIGGSINGYINQAINERLQKDGFPAIQRQDPAADPMQEEKFET